MMPLQQVSRTVLPVMLNIMGDKNRPLALCGLCLHTFNCTGNIAHQVSLCCRQDETKNLMNMLQFYT